MMRRNRSPGWMVYQVVLFALVWGCWCLVAGDINPMREGGEFALSIFVAVVVWWLLARYTRATLVVLGLLVSGGAFVLGWLYLVNNRVPGYVYLLAFPLTALWLLVLRFLWRIRDDDATDWWRR